MLFSVWNGNRRSYDYYETPGGAGPTHAPPATHVPMRGLGATPDEAAWPLPAGARKIGSGTAARGKIASLGSVSGSRTVLIVGGLLAAAWLGRRYLR